MLKTVGILVMALMWLAPTVAHACGGLVNPNGSISLLRATTLAGYAGGVEHYVTSFEFTEGGAEFGSIVPLPGVPSSVKRAGDWTLQRLVEEITPPVRDAFIANGAGDAASVGAAQVILETQIDALDITVLEGGGDEVGRWAQANGFALSPDAPEVLDFYARRSPVFMAARFDARRAEALGQQVGQGTPIHLTIPTPNPWVPLRILGLGLGRDALVEADVFLLTERAPALLPAPAEQGTRGLILERSEAASEDLLADLRSDKGMAWLPRRMHFTYLRLAQQAGDLTYDLAIDASGMSQPSPLAAGFGVSSAAAPLDLAARGSVWPVVAILTILVSLAWWSGGRFVRRRDAAARSPQTVDWARLTGRDLS